MASPQEIKDAYAELDLTPGASLEEVKASYHRLARALHPDLHPGTLGCLMSRVNQAYRLLVAHLASTEARSQGERAYQFQDFGSRTAGQARPSGQRRSWRDIFRSAARAAGAGFRARPAGPSAFSQDQAPAASGPLGGGQLPASAGAGFLGSAGSALGPLAGPPPWEAAGSGWRLVGLEHQRGELVYQVEVSGRPKVLVLPVRATRACRQCGGMGHLALADRQGLCPSCGGRGRIIQAGRVEVPVPSSWRPGQKLTVPAGHPQHVISVILNPPQGA